jgi:predicted transcriptional regulator
MLRFAVWKLGQLYATTTEWLLRLLVVTPAWHRRLLAAAIVSGLWYNLLYFDAMKTAISIPDDLFHRVENLSRRLKVSRSRFFAAAANEYLARHDVSSEATESWNRAAAEMARSGDDKVSAAMRRRSKAAIRSTLSKRA